MSVPTPMSPEDQLIAFESTGYSALVHWGIDDATLSLIKFRENAVFKVMCENGPYALRIHRMGYHSDDELKSELEWMSALRTHGIHTPKVIATTAGNLFIKQLCDALGSELQIDLFEWIEGQQLGSVEEGIGDTATIGNVYHVIGELAARVHNQSSTWEAPPGFVRHSWDAEGLAGDSPFWGRFWELSDATDEQRKLLVTARDVVFTELSKLPQTQQTYGLIHADFAAENIMLENGEVKLIDFDDAGYGWHLFEIATALYFIQDEDYFEQAKAALLAGYRSRRELGDEHLAHLPLLMLARSFTYVGWVHTRQETETARELTPMLLGMACSLSSEFLNNH